MKRKLSILAVIVALTSGLAMSGGAWASTEIRDPGGDPEAFWGTLDWSDLTVAEQALWGALGWDEANWSGEAPPPESEELYWHELSPREQAAARLLGYDATSWDGEPTLDLLFVQSAGNGTYAGDRLTLAHVLHTVFFSERPGRVVGRMSNADFAEYWSGTGLNAFSSNPPNAALSVNATGDVMVVELLGAPAVVGDTLTYEVRVLEGSTPSSFDGAVLFIDAYPTPVNGQITDAVTQAFVKTSDAIPTPINGQATD